MATSLVGKPVSSVRPAIGDPDKILDATKFNTVERGHIMGSFQPNEVPRANGDVFIYNRTPTVIVIFTRDGLVEKVYAGKT